MSTYLLNFVLSLNCLDCCLHLNFHGQLQGSSLETFLIIGKVSSEAVVEAKMMQKKSLLSWLNIWVEELFLEVRLFAMQMALWLLQVRKALTWT